MPKIYHSVPLDEEQNHEVREKTVWTSKLDGDTIARTASKWAWLAHAILLSISMTLFTLSFCRTGANTHASHASESELLSSISTYCRWTARYRAHESQTPLLILCSASIPGGQIRAEKVHLGTHHELQVCRVWTGG